MGWGSKLNTNASRNAIQGLSKAFSASQLIFTPMTGAMIGAGMGAYRAESGHRGAGALTGGAKGFGYGFGYTVSSNFAAHGLNSLARKMTK